jgi:alpha-L-rhamnosidase
MSLKRLVILLALLILAVPALVCSGENQSTRGRNPMQFIQLKCENLIDPMGIDAARPRLSWTMESARRGDRQTAYQILVGSSMGSLAKNQGDIWNSGRVNSDRSVLVEYQGPALESGKAYYWKVRVWDMEGKPSDWSRPAQWTMGLLTAKEWKGKWIGRDEVDNTYHLTGTKWIWFPEGEPAKSAPVGSRFFRRTVNLQEGRTIKDARLHVTADNTCTFFINGKQFCSTDDHSVVSEVDVAGALRSGANVIAASARNLGETPNPAGLIALLEVHFTDGTSFSVQTDAGWKSSDKEVPGWESPGFDDSVWAAARVLGPAGMAPWGEIYGLEDRRLPARWLRKEFTLEKNLTRATVYMCGLGLSELYINGKKVGDHVLSPALSEYPKRVYYVTHDVTTGLHQGPNAIGVVLGNGRYFAPRMHQPTHTQTYGYPKLLLQLRLEFKDGSSRDLVSDGTWKLSTAGPIQANNEYDGEQYDARMELDGWANVGFDETKWEVAPIVSPPAGVLHAQMINPIRVTGVLTPVSIKEVRPGVFIYDMGQNMVGWCRLRVSGPRGMQVSLRHSETVTPQGELYLDNIRGAKVTDLYTLKGSGTETFEPRFTYHGFRYVELKGFPGRPDLSTLQGRVVNDDVESAGEFSCSDPVVNRTYRNILWGVRGNYRSISTDCPQRDERQGWLGDRSAESRGETYLYDIATLYSKWLQDMADAQKENGSVSDVCPAYWPLYNDNVTWPSSTVIIPGAMLDQYADSALIRRHYPSMVKWIDHMSTFIQDDVITKDTYGDWCVPPEDPKLIHSNDPLRKTAGGILSTTFFYHDLTLMSRYATFLGKTADAQRFGAMADRLKAGLNRKYYNKEKGYYDNGSQTSCVLPLGFGMVPPEERQRVFDHLVRKITDETKGHVGTGLVGGQWLNRVLSENGRPDLAYKFATNITYPSWGYMAERGATTIWELWNGDSADPAMNSGNHVMLVGDLVIWLWECVAGIKADPERPGFKNVIMNPTPVGDLTFVKAKHNSPYGVVASEWRKEGATFDWTITVPVNAVATISVPAKQVESVTESGKPARSMPGVKFLRSEKGRALFELESGVYRFRSTPE